MKSRGALGTCLLGLALGLMPSLEARAQPAPGEAGVESALTDQAKQLYMDGVKEARRENWDRARDLFGAAFRLKPHFQIAFNLGRAELKTGQFVKAAEHVSLFLKDAQGVEESDRQIAQEMIQEAKRHIGTLIIAANPPGVEIVVDGVSRGKAPLEREVFVPPGIRLVEARLDGYQQLTETPTVTVGTSSHVELKLTKVGSNKEAKEGVGKVVIAGGLAAGVTAAVATGLVVASEINKDPSNNWLGEAGFVTFVAAGLLGAGTLVYALVSPDLKRSTTVTVLAGPRIAGVQATFRW